MAFLNTQELNSNTRALQDEISPRDLLFLRNLSKYGLTIVEIKVSPISPVINKTLEEINLPQDSLVVNIIKDDCSYFPTDNTILNSGDILYILTTYSSESSLRGVFIPTRYRH